MPERLIGAVLKTVVRASVPWVRIPPPPPFKTESEKALFFAIKCRVGSHPVGSTPSFPKRYLIVLGGVLHLLLIKTDKLLFAPFLFCVREDEKPIFSWVARVS